MRKVCLGLAFLAVSILAPSGTTLGGTPDLELREGSAISFLAFGSRKDVPPQSLAMVPTQLPAYSIRGLGSLTLPRSATAFDEYVDLFQNQDFQLSLDPNSGEAMAEFPLWVFDSDGNGVELPMILTTGVPSTLECGGWSFCIGGQNGFCAGTPWDTQTGELRLVGVALVPDDSGLTIECSGIGFELEATIDPANTDGDAYRDAVDNCPDHPDSTQTDTDADGIGNPCDNCPDDYNPTQRDNDGNGTGNTCEPLRVNFQPAASAVPAGYVKDTGAQYSQVTGRGWLGVNLESRDRANGGDQRLETFVFSSSAHQWEATLHPASYDLTLAVGDTQHPQGPHRVVTEQVPVLDGVMTAAGENLFADVEELHVTDGRLTAEIGGAGANTMLDFVDISESGTQPFHSRFVNFQPSGSPVPAGFEMDSGLVYDAGRGYGWEVVMGAFARDRGTLGDPVLDTFIFSGNPRIWELDLPADYYEVVIGIGDAQYPQGPHKVMVEDEVWLDSVSTATGEFLTLNGRLLVLDGKLTVTIGGAGGPTMLNYIAVSATPRDPDEDLVENLNDNCIDVYNPGQEDSNGNGVGDHCSADTDGDGHPDPLDNCPLIPNENQLDSDHDDHGNVCDCAPSNASVHASPVEVALLLLSHVPGAASTLAWSTQVEQSGAGTVYDLASGTLSVLRDDTGFDSAICLYSDRNENTYQDQRVVPANDGFYFLVRGDNMCEPAGTYGSDDAGARATLDSSGPCP